jgi:hypothetical protein
MSQKFVHATCLISGSASPVSRTNGSSCTRPRTVGDLLHGRAGLHTHVDRLEMPRSSGTRCGTNVIGRAEFLFHLGDVAMMENAVGRHRAVILGEVRAIAGGAAAPEMPDLASTITSASSLSSPRVASGSSASSAPVG